MGNVSLRYHFFQALLHIGPQASLPEKLFPLGRAILHVDFNVSLNFSD
jgi:hypothetical protein